MNRVLPRMAITDPEPAVLAERTGQHGSWDSSGSTATQVRGTMAAYAARLLIGAVMGIVISRALEPDGRGTYSVVVVIASIATVLGHLSIGQATIALWSAERRLLPATNLVLGAPLGTAAAVAAALFVLALGPSVVPLPEPGLMVLALLAVPIAVTVVHLTTVTLLFGRVDIVNRALTIAAALQCAALIALAWAGTLTTSAVVWAWAVAGALPLLWLLATVRPFLARPSAPLARRLITTGAEYHIGVVALFLLLRVDVLLLNGLASVAAVGLYTLAVSIGEMTYAGTDALSQALLRRQAESPIADAAELTARTLRVAVVVATASVVGVCVAAPLLVPLVYGEAFRGSVAPLFALAPGLIAYGATRGLAPYLLRLGRPRVLSTLSVASLGVNVVLNLILIPRWGLVGCALATSSGYIALAAGQVTWFSRSANIPLPAIVPGFADLRLVVEAARRPFGHGWLARRKAP